MKIRQIEDWFVFVFVLLGAAYGVLQIVFVFDYFFRK